jgi:uncharacterized repeat protein (TIGR03806 family)
MKKIFRQLPYSIFLFLFVTYIFYSFKNIDKKILSEEKENLSEYYFFKGDIKNQEPIEGILPYQLNTPLFSDYAEKLRFVQLPKGEKVSYNAENVLSFPVGTTIIKTFYYPTDFRVKNGARRLMETRLLIHELDGWKALEYVWNDEQTDAFLEVAGDKKQVQYIDNQGKKQSHDYVIPNLNQCKGCHNYDEKMTPIGPSARQLNADFQYANVTENQLLHWQKKGILEGLPNDFSSVTKAAVWNNPQTGSLNDRARSWLDVNCAHCHNPHGPAKTSGLNLSFFEKNPTAIGIMKSPIAAGKGSGNLQYDIVPKHPEKSILLYRIDNLEPGEMMPELGRKVNHKEGIVLIKEWIKEME